MTDAFRFVLLLLFASLICTRVTANEIFTEAAQVAEAVLVVGSKSVERLDQIEIGLKQFETTSSLNERLLAAKRLAALLYFPAIPTVARRRQLTEDPLGRSEFPCKDALIHFGSVFTVQEARGIAMTGNGNPALDLPGTSCMVDITTHLEGLRAESRHPIRRMQLDKIIRRSREYMEYDLKTHVKYVSYPIPYSMPSEEFDVGVQEPYKGLPERLHRVGAELIAILNDVTKPVSDRVLAATWLGRMKYVIAIPALIDQIDLESPAVSHEPTQDTDPARFPCVAALAEFRSSASIDLAKRIAQSASVSDAAGWKHKIWSEDALRGVITHLRGMAIEEADPTRRAKLQSFVRVLYADEADVSFPWSILFSVSIAIVFAFVGGWALGSKASRFASNGVTTVESVARPRDEQPN